MITWSPGTGIKQKSRVLILRTDENPKGVTTLDMISVVESVAQSEETSSPYPIRKKKTTAASGLLLRTALIHQLQPHTPTSRSQGKRNTSPNNKNGRAFDRLMIKKIIAHESN